MYPNLKSTIFEVCHPYDSRAMPSGWKLHHDEDKGKSIMSISYWSGVTWRQVSVPGLPRTARQSVLDIQALQPKLRQLPEKGCGGRRFAPWSAAGRASALRESTVRTGRMHSIGDRGGTVEGRPECLSLSEKPEGVSPYRSVSKEAAISCKRRETYAWCTSIWSRSFPGHRRRGGLGGLSAVIAAILILFN